MTDEIEWPREIWMAERDDHDQGVVSAVLSEHATIARFEGDTEHDREFHRYVDGDIFDSSERYWRARLDQKIDSLTVKPLVWKDFEDRGARAQAFGLTNYLITRWSTGTYEVRESAPGYSGPTVGEGHYQTIEDAKAAAQADYERRIRDALRADT